ncbi:hypothetical protein H5410_061213 [Solanum commersonii]|uniref:Uncharacterized protein n=1 Tax=Solanum commersonii TaxID=4109 RepID=A0A9J5W7Y6_SOLCO|nr:hypothetical protein H5410_061213 [Solanum commersonii]
MLRLEKVARNINKGPSLELLVGCPLDYHKKNMVNKQWNTMERSGMIFSKNQSIWMMNMSIRGHLQGKSP